MLSTFYYAPNIPEEVKVMLEDKESLCEEVIFEKSTMSWTVESDHVGRRTFVITKHGLSEFCLAKFSGLEIEGLSEEDFKTRIMRREAESQKIQLYLCEKIDEWQSRLNYLFELIEQWTPDDYEFEKLSIMQIEESIMVEHQIPPRDLPMVTVVRNTKKISFVPSALWTIGADGRVNVNYKKKQYVLLDRRRSERAPNDWHIICGRNNDKILKFTHDVYQKFLGGRL
ncbi:MAG: hypothetical protein HRT89_07980 [Lentisphaeria bacterium]|nr:hypothetical protein [Lentisphaeria bacterium]